MSRIGFFVPGRPYPQGSMVQSQHGGIHHSGGIPHAEWRRKVTAYALSAKGTTTLSGPIGISLSFYLDRPKFHFLPANSRRTTPEVKPGAPPRPDGAPDLDKLIRSILDSLTDAQVWGDDGQVVFISAAKNWSGAMQQGVDITVGPIRQEKL